MYQVSQADVKRILDHFRQRSTVIVQFSQVHTHGFEAIILPNPVFTNTFCSAFTPTRTYAVRTDDETAYLIKTAESTTSITSTRYFPNSIETERTLLELVAAKTDFPVTTVHAFDVSATLVPFAYLLLAHPKGVPLALARTSGKLSPRQAALLDLRLGSYFKQLHERVQNDWFGLPNQAQDELYSWQEAFTLLIETVLEDAREAGVVLPYEDVRQALARAIGFFLFDDCEVPSLVSFTADEHSVFVDLDLTSGAPEDEEISVTSVVSLGHSMWGDPLLETLFLEPSAAFVEGYGGPLVVFARQKTKRLWYTLFLALIVLVQAKRAGLGEGNHERVKWAQETAEKSAIDLKDAPCY